VLPGAVLLQQQGEDEGEGGGQPVGKHLPAGTGVRGGRTPRRAPAPAPTPRPTQHLLAASPVGVCPHGWHRGRRRGRCSRSRLGLELLVSRPAARAAAAGDASPYATGVEHEADGRDASSRPGTARGAQNVPLKPSPAPHARQRGPSIPTQPSLPRAPPAAVPIPAPRHSHRLRRAPPNAAFLGRLQRTGPRARHHGVEFCPQAAGKGIPDPGGSMGWMPRCPPPTSSLVAPRMAPFPGGTVPSSPAARSTTGNICFGLCAAPSRGSTMPAIFQTTALEQDQGMGSRPDPLVPSALRGPRGHPRWAPRSGARVEGYPWAPTWSSRPGCRGHPRAERSPGLALGCCRHPAKSNTSLEHPPSRSHLRTWLPRSGAKAGSPLPSGEPRARRSHVPAPG